MNSKIAAATHLPVAGTIAPDNSSLVAALRNSTTVDLAQTIPPSVPPGTTVPPRPAPPLLPDYATDSYTTASNQAKLTPSI